MLSRSPAALAAIARTAQPSLLLPVQAMAFTGKTESGFKYKTPKLRMRKVQRVEAPGLKLKIPADLDAETFCKQIGGDCDDIADKFETIDEVFNMTTVSEPSPSLTRPVSA